MTNLINICGSMTAKQGQPVGICVAPPTHPAGIHVYATGEQAQAMAKTVGKTLPKAQA